MNTNSEKYEFQLFLEGIRVEFTGASVNTDSGGISASISLPPHPSILDIKERTLVQLFYKKFNDKNWRLLFDGEVLSFNIAKSHNMNNFILNCRDVSSYLDLMYIYLSSTYDISQIDANLYTHFGAPNSPIDIRERSSKTLLEQNINTEQKSIINIVDSMIKDIIKVNDFFRNVESKHRFLDRFFYNPDEQVNQLIDVNIAKLIQEQSPYSGMQTVRGLMTSFLNMVFYEPSFISAPSYIDGKLNQIIYKPDNFALVPPRCNVVFPNMLSQFNYARNFMTEPTRLSIRTSSGLNEQENLNSAWQYQAYAPRELEDIKNQNDGVLHYSLINNETYKGIIPEYIQNLPTAVLMQGVKFASLKSSAVDGNTLALNYCAEYMFQKSQYISRQMQVQGCTFNPGLTCGFPGVVIAPPWLCLGVIKYITHSIDAGGGMITTSFSMDHSRIIPAELSDFDKKKIDNMKKTTKFDWDSINMTKQQTELARLTGDIEYGYPLWLNENYKPSKINTVYNSLLGCRDISQTASPNSESQIDMIREIYKVYKTYEDRNFATAFSDAFIQRSIVTKEDFYDKFLKQTKINDEFYSVGPGYFNPIRQTVIAEYKSAINQNSGMII
jgi:uncharacterized protein YcgL (UPF0745 family)